MSTYFTIEGEITYKGEEEFKKAWGFLVENGWVDEDYPQESPYISPSKKNTIVIPHSIYRNLGRVIEGHVVLGAIDGYCNVFCNDGFLSGVKYTFNKDGVDCLDIDFNCLERASDIVIDAMKLTQRDKDMFEMTYEEFVSKYPEEEMDEVDYYHNRSESAYNIFLKL